MCARGVYKRSAIISEVSHSLTLTGKHAQNNKEALTQLMRVLHLIYEIIFSLNSQDILEFFQVEASHFQFQPYFNGS